MAKIFPIHKVEELAAQTETASILPLIQIVQNWQKDYHSGTLRTDKETDREQGYNQQIFGEILGYKFQPEADWTIKSKPSAQGGQIPDAILTQASEENIQAVIEYKGASISLDKPQQREGHLSPVQQAFKYKPQYRHCPFVIVSNFYEFRLYQDNQLDYEVWTLDDLANPDKDYLNFKTWYYLLKAENFVTGRSESLLSEVRMEQEQISKKFYADYKAARLELLRDIWRKNPETHHDFNFAISKAQKIIDRIVFVCFAEDRGLIPDNKIQEVLDAGEKNPFGLWPFFQGFFSAIDHGSDKLEIPEGYNGGLFKEDAGLNSLKISDEALKQVVALNRYDFIEDLSVSILGHIFEQSISDLEEIKEKVNPDEIETTSKRKKDGIFYTPDYIVRYIVDNALGAYLRENEARIKEEVGLKEDLQDQNYAKREQEAYIKYQDFLQHIKVLDPACGSGAFLVVVFDYLLAENQRVGDILGNDLFSQDDYIRDILANNIYGVDLNEESVEITRLSLWLKTAKKGKKLTALDGNIKCGNSLIDDPEVAGDKAFDWAKEFPDIFATGGFDVVVGNPPYGAKISKNQILNLAEKYSEFGISNALNDTYFAFYALGLGKLLKSKGILGF
ncbi:MAG: N-6 DNA methylase, partial [Streptococcaceae bacterium]|nr:N-6 DNA methylase [Streptococcaceae bacterium]